MEIIKESKINLDKIVTALKNGAVLVCPTDTVYGLVCDATNKKAVKIIFEIKKRDKSKPLPIFVKNMEMAKNLAFINKDQEKILNKKWPGKFTFVLKNKNSIKFYGADKDTIALRIPKYKFLNNLLEKFGKPLAETSVNISGQPALIKIKESIEVFENKDDRPDIIIDAGDLPESKSSKIIDLSGGAGKVLRY